MPDDDFAEVQRQLESIASELKDAPDPERRRTLLREMSRLVPDAERISSQPPKMNRNLNRGDPFANPCFSDGLAETQRLPPPRLPSRGTASRFPLRPLP